MYNIIQRGKIRRNTSGITRSRALFGGDCQSNFLETPQTKKAAGVATLGPSNRPACAHAARQRDASNTATADIRVVLAGVLQKWRLRPSERR